MKLGEEFRQLLVDSRRTVLRVVGAPLVLMLDGMGFCIVPRTTVNSIVKMLDRDDAKQEQEAKENKP